MKSNKGTSLCAITHWNVLTKPDLDPIRPDVATWGAPDFANYWISDLINITSWSVGTAPLLVGLSSVDTIMIILLSGFCNAIPTVLNGYVGSDHRISFAIAMRSSFGYYFAFFPIISRVILSAV